MLEVSPATPPILDSVGASCALADFLYLHHFPERPPLKEMKKAGQPAANDIQGASKQG
jgi:hypothetical protein